MNQQAPYVRATDYKPEDDLFFADRVVGYVVTLLAGIGIGATITAVCVWVAVRVARLRTLHPVHGDGFGGDAEGTFGVICNLRKSCRAPSRLS